MIRMKWAVTFLLMGAWTIMAWLADKLVSWAVGASTAGASQIISHPDSLSWLTGAIGLAESTGRIVILAVWIAGCLCLLAVPAVLGWLAKRGPGSSRIAFFRRKGE